MATKKNTAPVEEQITETAPVEAMNLVAENEALKAELEAMKAKQAESETAAVTGPKMVKVKIPKTKEQKEDVFVSVNFRTYQIKRGIEVEVPDFVAEVLQHQEEMLESIALFEEQLQNKHK